jgi:hypothetical protein
MMGMPRGLTLLRAGVACLGWALAGCEDAAPVEPAHITLQAPQPGDYVLVRVSSWGLPYPISAGPPLSRALLDDTLTLGQAGDVRQVWRIRDTRGSASGAGGGDSISTITRIGNYSVGSDQRGPLIVIRGALYTSPVAGPPPQWAESPVVALPSDFGIAVYAPSRWRNGEIDFWEYRKLSAAPVGIDPPDRSRRSATLISP